MEAEVNRQRYEKLGYVPQKENVYNKLLPYADKLDEESKELFASIKTNLVKSVLAREMRPGCALWTSRLNRYLKIYGLKFSKEDHIALIKLYYELLTMPDLEPTRISKCASTLTQLLKKKYLISRDDLQLEWRPLYELCVRVLEKSKSEIGMYRCLNTLDGSVLQVIRLCRTYFPAAATQEILDEFRPYLCPLDNAKVASAVDYLEIFLPICVKPEEAAISYRLWFEELMTFWNVCHNSSGWESNMMWLMARLSINTIGHIDWEPYIPLMFVRFLRSFQLPVAYRKKQTGKQYKIDTSSMAMWIVASLHRDHSSTFFHLEKFMQALESYFHSANTGRWSLKLRELLRKLAYYLVQRVYCERHKKPSWEPSTPETHRLTDDDLDRFVLILKPCLDQAMFFRQGNQDIALALQYLTSLRPNLIIPMTLDKLYASMDSLTEPHKLTSSMIGVTAVARYMVQGHRTNYPEGFTHVLPLLMALLPGIDGNDMRKCLVTFNFMVHFINMIPMINSSEASKYHADLTEEEHIVCEASAGFEDFLMQFFDRLLLWVESNSLDFVRLEQVASSNNAKNRAELIAETALFSVIGSVLHQCSPEIFTAALRKIFNFVVGRVMEIQISGKMIAIIVQGFAKVNPKETLKLFIPHLCDTIERLMDENANIEKEEHLDAELLYNLQILSEIVDGRTELHHYSDRLLKIIDRTLHMASLHGSTMAARALEVMISSLTYILPLEYRSSPTPYDTPVKDFLSIREWGQAQRISELKIDWYTPNEDDIKLVQTFLRRYLIPELEVLERYAAGEEVLSREALRKSLKIVISILSAHPALPIWQEPAIQLVDSVLDPWAFNLIVNDAQHSITMPNGDNVRKSVADTVHRVQQKILEIDEGDVKSLQNVVHIYNILLFSKSRSQDFEYHWKNFHMVKKLLEDRLHQNKLHLRHILINRAMLQQEFRIESRSCSFTATHKQILLDLFELSVSRYSEVRTSAQMKLSATVSYFAYSYTVLTPKILQILRLNSQEHHEAFKGCLYILLGPKSAPIVTRHDWSFIHQLWPLIVRSRPSEKPSIINLINAVVETVSRHFPTIAINLVFSPNALEAARILAVNVPKCNLDGFKKEIECGEENLRVKCGVRADEYTGTVDALLDACLEGNLQWRYHMMALTFLKTLVHYDVKYNVRVIKYFLKGLIDESINVRKISMRVVLFILVQNKPQFEKIEIDPFAFSDTPKTDKLAIGLRPDNKWLLYDSKTVPKSEEEWEKARYLHNHSYGYYAWPKKLLVYGNSRQQPNIDKRFATLTQEEREIFEFFDSDDNLEQFIKYFSMEDKKGKDQFSAFKFLLFKNLFKIFEDKLLDKFLSHVQRLVADKNDSCQRCAAEIISGLIRGSKHWSYAKIDRFWTALLPILHTAIANMCTEMVADWGFAIAMALESRDPNRHHFILESLLQDPLRPEQSTFVACARLHMLNVALGQQSWRNVELAQRLYDYLRPHLSHAYQNIRDKISSILATIFTINLPFPNSSISSPSVQEFFVQVLPTLDDLYLSILKKIGSSDVQDDGVAKALHNLNLDGPDEARENAMRLFKLVSKFITSSTVRMNYSTIAEYFRVVPLCAVLQSNDVDDEIAPICSNLLAVLAYTITVDEHMPAALEAMRKVACCPFWSARAVITEFMSGFIFHNMATIISRREWVEEFQRLVLDLLEDVQPEVRISASQVLSGLLHCQFIPEPNDLLTTFKQKSRTKLKKKTDPTNNVPNTLRIRHGGVLGMCAFISAHPYDVPDYLPDIFGQLGYHLNDPQPIPATIRKTLGDFKRTHHEDWERHKLKFTEEELSVFSDLTVPPSYYA